VGLVAFLQVIRLALRAEKHPARHCLPGLPLAHSLLHVLNVAPITCLQSFRHLASAAGGVRTTPRTTRYATAERVRFIVGSSVGKECEGCMRARHRQGGGAWPTSSSASSTPPTASSTAPRRAAPFSDWRRRTIERANDRSEAATRLFVRVTTTGRSRSPESGGGDAGRSAALAICGRIFLSASVPGARPGRASHTC